MLGLSLALPAPAQHAAEKDAPAKERTPEEIAKDAARDLKDDRIYNRPGTTPNAAWRT